MDYIECNSLIEKINCTYVDLTECLKPGNSGAHGKAQQLMAEVESLLFAMVERQWYLEPRNVSALIAYVAEIGIRCQYCNTTTLGTVQRWRAIF